MDDEVSMLLNVSSGAAAPPKKKSSVGSIRNQVRSSKHFLLDLLIFVCFCDEEIAVEALCTNMYIYVRSRYITGTSVTENFWMWKLDVSACTYLLI